MYKIIPYIKIEDNGYTLSDEYLLSLLMQMYNDKTLQTVFSAGTVTTPNEFIDHMKLEKNIAHIQVREDTLEPVFIGWINNFGYKHAMVHFNVFSNAWGKDSVDIMKNAFRYWFSFKDRDGSFLYETLLGVIAEDNKKAINFVKKCNVNVLGSIPNIIYDAYKDKLVGGTYCYITRKEFNQWDS